MIITLKGANFANSNIGTLDSYSIRFVGSGVTNSNTSVDRESNTGYTTTITLGTGYELNGSITVTMGGTDITSTAVNGLTITIPTKVTGNVVITVPTKNTATGEEGGGSEGDGGDTPITPSETVVAYTSRQSSSGISKTTGEYLSSSTGYVNVYENIDPLKAYAATSYAPGSTGENACVCYYTSDGTFISAESGSDWGISSTEYTMMQLTVPANASTIKLFGRTNNQEAVLYLTAAIVMDEISYSSQQTKSNLDKTTGEYGTSAAGYVNIYDNIDPSKTYYASGFCPNASGSAASVCYYTSNGTFISAQDGNDFGLSSAPFLKKKLTVPSNTSTIKVFSQSTGGHPAAALYIERT